MVLATRSRLLDNNVECTSSETSSEPSRKPAPTTPPRQGFHIVPSSLLKENFNPARPVQTPKADSSLLENDSPLPSPPSISKPKDHSRSPKNGKCAFPNKVVLQRSSTSAFSRQRPTSPTPAPANWRGERSSLASARHHTAVTGSKLNSIASSLGFALHSTQSTASSAAIRPDLESKLGIKLPVLAQTPPTTAGELQATDNATVSDDIKLCGMRPTTSHAGPLNSQNGREATGMELRSREDRLSAATSEAARPSTALSSQARRLRERTEEPAASEGVGKKRTWGGEEVVLQRRTSEEAPKSVEECASKSSTGSDSVGLGGSGSQRSSSPILKEAQKNLEFSTPALAGGARSLRSITATAGRSTARTLKRYGPGDARPQHVRPTRVMLTQGADESDEDDDEEPGVGVGTSPQQPKQRAYEPSSRAAPHHMNADEAATKSEHSSSQRGGTVAQSASKYLDGLLLRGSKSGSPRSIPDQPDEAYSVARPSRASEDRPANGDPENGDSEGDNSPPRSRRSREVRGQRLPDVQIGADDEDDIDAEEGITQTDAQQQASVREIKAPAPRRNESFPYSRVSRDSHPGDKENHVAAKAPESRQNKAGPLMAAMGLRSVRPVLISSTARRAPSQKSSPRLSEADSRQEAPQKSAEASVRQPNQPLAYTGFSPKCSRSSHSSILLSGFALDPRLAAEKQRLLDLNGWDPYVRAALDEAERQRHNGCNFGEHMVGKVMSNRKETKFRGAKYMKVSRAGEGGFSTVFQVLGPVSIPTMDGGSEAVPPELQAHFAMKQVSLKRLEQSSRDELLQEAQLLESLAEAPDSDKYVLRYFGHKHSGDTLKILMELGEMDFNTLLRTQHPLPRCALSEYWRQMLESVHFVHNAKLVHTDLKPANFLLVKGRVKLIDFGIAQKIPLGTMHISRAVIVGTPNYMAPEAIQKARRGGHGVYKAGKPSDVWSLGCILYQMVYGRTPFAHISGDRKLELITDPRHQIAFPPRRTLDDQGPRKQIAKGDEAEEERHFSPPAEELDEIVIDCMRAGLLYKAQSRATIPDLLAHLFVRDEVTLSRQKLKDIVVRIQTYMQQGGLNEDNVEEMAERLMTNLELDAFEPFAAQST